MSTNLSIVIVFTVVTICLTACTVRLTEINTQQSCPVVVTEQVQP